MSVRADLLDEDGDPRERPGYDDPEHCEVPPGSASGFEDDWWGHDEGPEDEDDDEEEEDEG